MNIQIVIPARMGSTRLANKMLLNETGKPLIQHTYEAASLSKLADSVVVATDDQQIVEAVHAFGGQAQITSSHHASGTDRIAEIARNSPETDLFVNVQGDEPELDPRDIDMAIELLVGDDRAHISTLATPITQLATLLDPDCVKVVFDQESRALYFSRSPIPYARDGFEAAVAAANSESEARFFQHIGLYVYRRQTLLAISALPRADAEVLESLEQLRALNAGLRILVGLTPHRTRGIDTPDDYRAFVSRQST